MKRFVCTILAALTVFTTLPLNALAADDQVIYPAGTVVDDDTDEVLQVPAGSVVEDESDLTEPAVPDEEEESDEEMFPAEDLSEQDVSLPVESSVDNFEDELAAQETDTTIRRIDEEGIEQILADDEAYDTEPAEIALGDEATRNPPSRPIAVSITRTSITVDKKDGVEYSIDGGQTWQEEEEFTDLVPGQEYTIYARYQATEDKEASEMSLPLTIETVARDTYIVSNEQELLDAFTEVSTLPATQERINVRFTNDITVTNTVVLPKLRGRMELYLDLYGFTLHCTRYGVPVVQIETRATLGSSYYLDAGSNKEQLHGGHLTATGDGKAIYITASAVAKLRGLTFTCGKVAIENEGDLALIENVHGGILNSGYIESINGMNTKNQIVNDGTIEEITNCSLGDTTGAQTIYRSEYSESLSAPLINRGIIGSITNTKVTSGSMVTIMNTSSGVINTMGGNNYFRNSNWGRSTVILNYGSIDSIHDGMYIGYRGCVFNYGEIAHITGGLFLQLQENFDHKIDGSSYFLDYIDASDAAFLREVGYPQTVIANWGTIPDISGGMYSNNRYSTWGLGNWYIPGFQTDGLSNYGDTWAWERLIMNMNDDATYAYREGYALSRSQRKYTSNNPYDAWSGPYTYYEGYIIDKAYRVTTDTSEADMMYLLNTDTYLTKNKCGKSHPLISGAYAVPGIDENIVAAPLTLAYVAGDLAYSPREVKVHYGRGTYVLTLPVRVIDGQADIGYTDVVCEECKLYRTSNGGCVYSVSDYECTYEKAADKWTFTMPAEDVVFKPNWEYTTRSTSQHTYRNYDQKLLVPASQWKYPSEISSAVGWEINTYSGDEIAWQGSSTGYSYSLTAYDLQTTQWQRRGKDSFAPSACPLRFYFEDRYKYQWSINQTDWYEEEEVPLTSDLLSTEGVTISSDQKTVSVPLYMRKVPREGAGDDDIKPGKAVKVITLQINAPYKPFSDECSVEIEDGYYGYTTKEQEIKVTTADTCVVRFVLIDEDGTESLVNYSKVRLDSWSWVTRLGNTFKITYSYSTSHYVRFFIKDLQPGQKVRVEYLYAEKEGSELWRHNGWLGTYTTYSSSYDINVMYAMPIWRESITVARKKSTDAPSSAPTVLERLDTSITVREEEGLEYSINGGSTWQTDGTFGGLSPNTEYTIISRVAATETSYVSAVSPGVTVSTRESADVLQAPTLVNKTETAITINTEDGYEYSIDSITWQETGSFTGLHYGTEYQIVSRKKTEQDYISPALKVRTSFNAPVLISKTDTSITIETRDGAEYQISGGSSWQTNGTFGGLSPNTEYTITARKRTEHDSASEVLRVKTKSVQAAPSDAPQLEGKTDVEVAVVPTDGMEYSIDGGKTWNADGYFDGLTEDTQYEIISRYTETDDCAASPSSPVLQVTTKFTQTAIPVAPKVLDITTNSIKIEIEEGQEYALREEKTEEIVRPWQEEDTFRGLESDTSYEILTRLTETETTAPSALCPQIVVLITKQYVSMGGSSVDSELKELHTSYVYGYPDGTFRPDQAVTRAEAAAMFSTAFQLSGAVSEVSNYSDIAPNDWYFTQIQQMSDAGYLSGYTDGTYKPNQGITRAEFVAIATKFITKAMPGGVTFDDIEGCWAKEIIEQAASIYLVHGYEDGTFRPNDTITRAEAVSIINVVLGRLNHCASKHGVTRSYFSDNQNKTAWYYHAILEASTPHIVDID